MQRFRGGLVFKAHRLCVSLNSRLESNKEEEKKVGVGDVHEHLLHQHPGIGFGVSVFSFRFRVSGFGFGDSGGCGVWFLVYAGYIGFRAWIPPHDRYKSKPHRVCGAIVVSVGDVHTHLLHQHPVGTVLNLRTTASHKRAAVPRRARS